MAKKAITEEQLRAANKAGYSTQQIAGEINKYEKRTWNDAVYSGTLPNGQTMNPWFAPTPQVTPPVQTQPIVQTPNPDIIDTSTGKPVSESPENAQYNILPENVTGVKVSPTLQAKIDARKVWLDTMNNQAKTDVQKSMDEKSALSDKKENAFNFYLKNSGQSEEQLKQTLKSAWYTDEEIADKLKGIANSTKPEYNAVWPNGEVRAAIDPATGKPVETSDLEKQAQATGVEYTMQNWQATYNPKTTEEAAKILAMGGKLAGETKMSAVAQASLNKVRGLGQMTDQQLANNIAGGQVSNKELELLNTMNPQLVAQAKELSKKKIITNTTNEIQADNSMIIKGEEPTGMSKPLQDLVNKLATIDADTKSPAEMKTAYQDAHPEMIQSRDQINELTKQKRDLQLAKMNLWKEWKEKNSSYPISMIMAGYSAASRDLDNSIYLINDDLNTEISNYNMYLDDMNAEIDFEIGQQGKEEQRLWDIYGVTSKEQIRNEDIQREDARIEQSIQLEEARYQRDIERDDMKSAQERKYKIEDMKNEMNMNIETGLMNLGVDPTGMTPEEMRSTYAQATGFYKQQEIDSANRGKASDYLKTTITNTDGSTREVFVNPMTWETIDASQAFGEASSNIDLNSVLSGYSQKWQELLLVPDGTVVPTRLWQVSPQNASIRGKECAEYVNDIAGTKMGNTYASKLAVCDEPTGWVWSVVAWKPNGSGSFGHTGIIVNEDADNYYVKSSNYVPWTVTTEKIPKGNIKNFYTPDAVKESAKMNKLPQVSKDILDGIDTLLDHKGLNNAVWFGLQKMLQWGDQWEKGFIWGTEAENFRNQFNSFRDNMVLPNLWKLKWPMSDKDIQFLRNSATSLNIGMSEAEFKNELNRIKNKILGISDEDITSTY